MSLRCSTDSTGMCEICVKCLVNIMRNTKFFFLQFSNIDPITQYRDMLQVTKHFIFLASFKTKIHESTVCIP